MNGNMLSAAIVTEGSQPTLVSKVSQENTIPIIQPEKGTSPDEAIARWITPLEPVNGQMLRVGLIELAENDHILVMSVHRLVADELAADFIMQVLLGGSLPETTSPPKTPKLEDTEFDKRTEYWKAQFAGISPVLEFPADYPRTAVASQHGRSIHFSLDATLTQNLNETAAKLGVTSETLLHAAHAAFAYRYTGVEFIIQGMPLSVGKTPIGANTDILPLVLDASDNPSFENFLKQFSEKCKLGKQNYLSLVALAEQLQIPPDQSRAPLVQVIFEYGRNPQIRGTANGLKIEPVANIPIITPYDVHVSMWESEGVLEGQFVYAADLFDRITVERMVGHFQNLLFSIADVPENHLLDLPMLTDAERHQLLN